MEGVDIFSVKINKKIIQNSWKLQMNKFQKEGNTTEDLRIDKP